VAEQHLKRILGVGFSVAACAGFIIGVGILRTPGEIAATISDPRVYMSLWIIGGAFTLLSVVVVAEIMAETPRSGGIYALIAHAWGPYPGFLVGWVSVAASAAANALKTVVLAGYLAMVIPAVSTRTVPLALAITTTFAGFQLAGLRIGSNVHQVIAAFVGVMMTVLIVALFLGGAAASSPGAAAVSGIEMTASGLAGWGVVIASVVFTYNGWIIPSAFGGEFKEGGRAIAIGALRGTVIVIAIYLSLNLALVVSVPLASLTGQDLALAESIRILYGVGTPVVVLAIVILLMHQNFDYMHAPRTLYALSVDGLGTERATSVTEKGTPMGAVVGVWMFVVLLILAGGFEFLLTVTSMLMLLMNFLVVVGVFRLRKREPDAVRPYRAWGFPITGYVCIAGFVVLVAIVGITQPISTLYVVGLVAISVVVYAWLKSRRDLPPIVQAD
jgi:APA family basic amino acid/polyamine antiporter